jgi:hypothetical protein
MNPTVADQVLVEWFADHARLEPLLADGTPRGRRRGAAAERLPGHG